MTRSNKLKLHRVNSRTIPSYLVRFSRDTLFYYLVSFAFSLLVTFLLSLFFIKINDLIHMRLCGRVRDKKFSHSRFLETRLLFCFGLSVSNYKIYEYVHFITQWLCIEIQILSSIYLNCHSNVTSVLNDTTVLKH